MKKISLFLIAFLLLGLLAADFPFRAEGCVGKKIIIGTTAAPEQKILANMLALLIRERTGTTVEIQLFPGMSEMAAALKAEKIQIYNEYLSAGLLSLNLPAENQPRDTVYKELKKEYNRRFNLIWLEPYGFLNSQVNKDSHLSAAPLIDKQTLKLFPALPRLLNKLGGKITDVELGNLIKIIQDKNLPEEDVARDFLKQEKLI